MKHKIIIISFFLLLLTPILIQAEETTAGSTAVLKNLIVAEEIKTRTQLRTYCDKKITQVETLCVKKGEQYINENFQLFEDKIRSITNKMLIKVLLGIIGAILFSQIIWYLLRERIKKLKKKKEKPFTT